MYVVDGGCLARARACVCVCVRALISERRTAAPNHTRTRTYTRMFSGTLAVMSESGWTGKTWNTADKAHVIWILISLCAGGVIHLWHKNNCYTLQTKLRRVVRRHYSGDVGEFIIF